MWTGETEYKIHSNGDIYELVVLEGYEALEGNLQCIQVIPRAFKSTEKLCISIWYQLKDSGFPNSEQESIGQQVNMLTKRR